MQTFFGSQPPTSYKEFDSQYMIQGSVSLNNFSPGSRSSKIPVRPGKSHGPGISQNEVSYIL
jgi:hypothetical protein